MRTTSNRFASMVVPAVMGVVAEMVGVQSSFFWIGGTLISLCLIVAVFVHRIPGFKS